MPVRQGKYTLMLPSLPGIAGYAAVVGKKEGEGPLAEEFDYIYDDGTAGEDSWEKAESVIHRDAVTRAISKAGISSGDADVIFAGDLLNQCTGTTFGIREMGIPFMGVYGACSTMALSMAAAAACVDSLLARTAIASTSSHFCSAEKQFRMPLEYGGQRTPTAQWTATAAGAAVITKKETKARIEKIIIGRIQDYGIKDANNMGAAMAPAAYHSIRAHFDDLRCGPSDFDLIVTGDLGQTGKELLMELARKDGVSLGGKITDCGSLIFDNTTQDVHAGGSGCGCSAITLCGYLLEQLKSGKLKKILFCGTGALLSPTSTQQGLPIPGVCHVVCITGGR